MVCTGVKAGSAGVKRRDDRHDISLVVGCVYTSFAVIECDVPGRDDSEYCAHIAADLSTHLPLLVLALTLPGPLRLSWTDSSRIYFTQVSPLIRSSHSTNPTMQSPSLPSKVLCRILFKIRDSYSLGVSHGFITCFSLPVGAKHPVEDFLLAVRSKDDPCHLRWWFVLYGGQLAGTYRESHF